MSNERRSLVAALGIAAALLCTPTPVRGQGPLQAAAIVERLGSAVPRDLAFTDQNGRRVTLGSLLGDKPLVISLAYFTCPMLCALGQEGAAAAFRDSGWRLGADFRAVTISIDPHDTPELATEWRGRAAAGFGAPLDRDTWPYLVGDEPTIRRLADAVGFEYARDPATGQYSHAAALFVAGADGRLSRYVYGITFDARDLAQALSAARDNRRMRSGETFLMRCFHYVPSIRQHGSFVVWMLRTCGLLVTAAVGSLLFRLWRREVRG